VVEKNLRKNGLKIVHISILMNNFLMKNSVSGSMYHNSPGFAEANSNMEGINGDFKIFFTKRKRLSI
jgi:hypothetical protein